MPIYVALDFKAGSKSGIYFLLIIMIFIISLACVKKFIDTKKYSRDTNKAIIIISTSVIIIVPLLVGLIFGIGNIMKNQHKDIAIDLNRVTLADFGYEENKQEIIYNRVDKSILAQKEDVHYESEGDSLEFTTLESGYLWVINLHESRLLNRLNKYLDMKEVEYNSQSNIEIYSDREGKVFVLILKNKVVEIRRSFTDISEEEFLNKILRNI